VIQARLPRLTGRAGGYLQLVIHSHHATGAFHHIFDRLLLLLVRDIAAQRHRSAGRSDLNRWSNRYQRRVVIDGRSHLGNQSRVGRRRLGLRRLTESSAALRARELAGTVIGIVPVVVAIVIRLIVVRRAASAIRRRGCFAFEARAFVLVRAARGYQC